MNRPAQASRGGADRPSGRPPRDPYASDPARPATSALTPWWRWLFVLPGLAALGYGGVGLLGAGQSVPLRAWMTWYIGSALVHDVIIAPLWIGLCWLGGRVLPFPARAPMMVGAAVAGVLTLVALPFVLGFGADPNNPSFLPRDYGRNLALLDGAILLIAAVWAWWATVRSPRPQRRPM